MDVLNVIIMRQNNNNNNNYPPDRDTSTCTPFSLFTYIVSQ